MGEIESFYHNSGGDNKDCRNYSSLLPSFTTMYKNYFTFPPSPKEAQGWYRYNAIKYLLRKKKRKCLPVKWGVAFRIRKVTIFSFIMAKWNKYLTLWITLEGIMSIRKIAHQQTIVTIAVHRHSSFNIPSSALTGCNIVGKELNFFLPHHKISYSYSEHMQVMTWTISHCM